MTRASWTDATSYSRGERGESEPRIWHLELDGLLVIVHRWHGLDGWFVTCHAMGVDKETLAAAALDSAKNEALIILRGRARRWLAKLDSQLLHTDGEAE